MTTKLRAAWCLFALLSLTGCAGGTTVQQPITLNVFAASSLTGAFTDLGQAFEMEHPGVHVAFNFAGSQQLAQQIGEGAPADVFASANQKQMDAAIQSGRVAASAPQVFAHNRLVVIYPKDNPAGLLQLQDLAKPGLKLVLADKSVPAGQYALDFLDKTAKDAAFGSGYPAGVLKNVVSYEVDVKSVLSKVALGEADAGIVYVSDVAGTTAGQVSRLEIPDALNVLATYPLASLKDSPQPDLAQAFINFVLGEKGQAILKQHGLIPAGER